MILIFGRTWEIITTNFKKVLPFLIFQTLIQLISAIGELMGMVPGTAPAALMDLLEGVLSIWNFTFLMHTYISIKEKSEDDVIDQVVNATYDTPAFFLYSLLYGLTIVVGTFLFIIPGFYFAIFHYFAPMAAVLKPEANDGAETYLSYSRKIVKPHWPLVLGFFITLVILNLAIPSISWIPAFKELRVQLQMLSSPLEALFILFGDMLGIVLFYYLTEDQPLSDENPL